MKSFLTSLITLSVLRAVCGLECPSADWIEHAGSCYSISEELMPVWDCATRW